LSLRRRRRTTSAASAHSARDESDADVLVVLQSQPPPPPVSPVAGLPLLLASPELDAPDVPDDPPELVVPDAPDDPPLELVPASVPVAVMTRLTGAETLDANVASPPYVATMVCVPAGRELDEAVALPVPSRATAAPIGVPFALMVTFPVGVPVAGAVAATVTSNVTV
jgi:hypothetical protein